MKLRRMELFGFKSFMERTRLRFDDGMTGIVGPNGCGKSNLVDAIRWVMGEQSVRMLRGKNMEDVIFAGSESKPPMGMAEVALTFENDGHNVPPEYAQYSEITVSRRLFRSGESEYSINKTACRLLDVQELFMGTGVGTRAYSIIGQGQIGLLVSLKPQDRRVVIEEAAGVSKYRARRKVAERKMELTRQNLLRVNDVVTEIGRNLDALQRQARKAARYLKLKEQVREVELRSATHRFLELSVVRRHLSQKQQALADQGAALQSRIASREASIEERRLVLMEEERGLSEMQERLLSADNQIRLHEQNMEFLNREIQAAGSRSQESANEIETLHARIGQIEREAEQAERELAEVEAQASGAELRLRERAEQQSQQESRVREIETTLEGVRARQLQLGTETGELRSRQTALEQRLIDRETRLGQLEGEAAALEKYLGDLAGQRTDARRDLSERKQLHLNLTERRAAEENSLADLRSQLAQTEARAMALREEISDKRSRLSSLQQIMRDFEGCQNGVRQVMMKAREQSQQDRVVGLVADVLQAPPRYETAVQAVLGDRLQGVVVRSQEAGLAAIDYLKAESQGRSSFIPLSLRDPVYEVSAETVHGPGVIGPMRTLMAFEPQYEGVVRYLLGDVVVVEDLSSALAVWRSNGHKATLVTLDGEVLEPEGVLTGGSLEGPGAHLLAHKRQIRELSDALQDLEAQHALVQAAMGQMKAQLSSAHSALDSLRQNSHEEEIRIVDREKDLHHLDAEISRQEERLGGLRREKLEQETQRDRCREERSELLRQQETLSQEQARLDEELRELRERLERERAELARLSQECLDLKVRAAAGQERLQSSRRRREAMQATRAEIQERLSRLRQEVNQDNLQVTRSRSQIEESRQEIATLLNRKECDQKELALRRQRYEELLASIGADELLQKNERRELDEGRSLLGEIGLRLQESELALSHLVEDVRRAHRTELGECVSRFHLMPPPDEEALARAAKLRSAMERMGDVNPGAVEEYERLKQRHEFLSTQSRDLQDSLEKLETVIQKINRASRKRFREAFDAINLKFQEIFPRLFNGGRAHLALEEVQDVLEAGVDIVAQPPGKKLQNIELLSGGEKALTAVSLLFSIFLVKPTPFCLLDEVDAPLDEVNIDRVNAMIREMSKTSQFIIITHNKRTMETVDRLYGVTMEEPGVSTMIAVQLKDIDTPKAEQAA
ncbi:MAG: chromosome segregation protein SMC [Myxococcales bacterium]|nr:chromosome segregation protein SMC [Myxococcales bacterium]